MVIYIPESSVRIVNSNNYVDGDEVKLADTFNIEYVPHFFPIKFLRFENMNYVGPALPFEMFLSSNDDKAMYLRKKIFYQLLDCETWSFHKELMIYANLKLQLLTNAMLFFVKESFEFQSILKSSLSIDGIERPDLNLNVHSYINAFNHPICSIGSLMFNIYNVNYKNYLDLFCVRKEYGIFNKTVSRSEHKFTSYMHYKYPDRNLVSAFSSDSGQKYFKQSIPDLYCEDSKEAWFFCGCQIHGHISEIHNTTENNINFFGHSFKDLNNDLNSKLENLLLNNETVERVNLVWECEFKNQIKNDPDLKIFLDHHYIEHPLQRLIPRSTMRGAFVETYAYRWSKLKYPTEKFIAIDVNGLYSSVAIDKPFMTGKYEVVMGKKLCDLKIENNMFYYQNNRIMGSALITILPPTDLKYPYLTYRKVDDQSINTLCKTCAETNGKFCRHNENQRCFTAVYMCSEIEYALSLGYKLLAIYELHAYQQYSKILQPFVVHLNFLKTKYSDLFDSSVGVTERANYCNVLNDEMNLSDHLRLSLRNVKNNKAKRTFYKMAAHSFCGKFSQRQDRQTVNFVSNQEELEKLVSSDCVSDLFCVSENLCMVTTSKNKLKLPPNLKYNVYIGSQITAYARQRIHEHIMVLSKIDECTLYHVNCDSLYFSIPLDKNIPFKINHAVGNFKHVYEGEILTYFSLAPRQYCATYKAGENLEVETHISGLSLRNTITPRNFDEILDIFLLKYEHKMRDSLIIPATKNKISISNFKVKEYSTKFTLTNKLSQRRIVNPIDRFITFPYGFKEDK